MSGCRWSRDELIPALDLYFQIAPRAPDPGSEAVRWLSDALRLIRPEEVRHKANYRSPDAVVMKLMNFRNLDPAYGGAGLSSVASADRAVWAEFANDRGTLARVTAAFKAAIDIEPVVDGSVEDFGCEGDIAWRRHLKQERDAGLARRRKADALARDGRLVCEACGFDFEAVYGPRGRGVIECHHVQALSGAKGKRVTKASDLALLCANCHRLVHAKRPWLTLEELLAVARQI
jgi:5-methylcytosine-specific restriction protein A